MKRLIGILAILFLLFVIAGSYLYYIWFAKSIVKNSVDQHELFIPSSIEMKDFYELLRNEKILKQQDNFEMYMVIRSFKQVKGGRYIIESGMNCHDLATMFARGLQSPIQVAITPSRLPQDLAGKLGAKLELDSLTILNALKNEDLAKSYGFSALDFYSMFICDSYEMYWNTSLEGLLDRMKREYDNFWNEDRLEKAAALKLDQKEVIVLASIVYAEQNQHADERARIAGLYLNRLRIGMLLQSDPTLVFALGDFKKKRVLNVDKEIDSPYNTYKYTGLPPGPIYSPEKQSIDAVLNPENNKYLYMCAKEDFSGYHAFATNLSQHNNNARRYQRALNKARIYR